MKAVDYPGLYHSIKLIFTSVTETVSGKKFLLKRLLSSFYALKNIKIPERVVLFLPKPYIFYVPSEKFDN